MVSSIWPIVGSLTKHRIVIGWLLVFLVSCGCRSGCDRSHARGGAGQADTMERTSLGEVRVGNELVGLYIAYGFDSAILGFAVSIGAEPVRYFPIYASTDRGVPSVTLEVLASKSEGEMWVRSSWKDNEILAYHRVGTETAITGWGEVKFIEEPMPDQLSGGPLPFPEPTKGTVVSKATFHHD